MDYMWEPYGWYVMYIIIIHELPVKDAIYDTWNECPIFSYLDVECDQCQNLTDQISILFALDKTQFGALIWDFIPNEVTYRKSANSLHPPITPSNNTPLWGQKINNKREDKIMNSLSIPHKKRIWLYYINNVIFMILCTH